MPSSTETDDATLCTWCGLFLGVGPTCEVCGSPMTGGHLLDDDQPIRPPQRRKPRVVKASDVKRFLDPTSDADHVPCPWCRQMSTPGPICELCGSPMAAGDVVALSDDEGESTISVPVKKISVRSRGAPEIEPLPQPLGEKLVVRPKGERKAVSNGKSEELSSKKAEPSKPAAAEVKRTAPKPARPVKEEPRPEPEAEWVVMPPQAKAAPVKAEPAKVEPKKPEPKPIAKAEPPKPQAPRAEPPKAQAPKVERPKIEPPKVETKRLEPSKAEPAKVESKKVEPPKTETRKPEPEKAPAPEHHLLDKPLGLAKKLLPHRRTSREEQVRRDREASAPSKPLAKPEVRKESESKPAAASAKSASDDYTPWAPKKKPLAPQAPAPNAAAPTPQPKAAAPAPPPVKAPTPPAPPKAAAPAPPAPKPPAAQAPPPKAAAPAAPARPSAQASASAVKAAPPAKPSAPRAAAAPAVAKPAAPVKDSKSAAKSDSGKKLVPCARCGDPTEQSPCETCREALSVLRELSQ